MTTSESQYPILGDLLAQYLDGRKTFVDLESTLAETADLSSEDRNLFKRIYHILNHYDMDDQIRVGDAEYAVRTTDALRAIAASLQSGSAEKVRRAVEAFWRPPDLLNVGEE